MSGIITLIPGDTDPGHEIVNGNERSELDNRSHINHGHWSPADTGDTIISVSPAMGHGFILTCSAHKLMKIAKVILRMKQYIYSGLMTDEAVY